MLTNLSDPRISLDFGHDFKGYLPSYFNSLLKLSMIKVTIRTICHFFKELGHEIEKLFTIGINFESALLVLINDLSVSLILFEEEFRDVAIIRNFENERNFDILVIVQFFLLVQSYLEDLFALKNILFSSIKLQIRLFKFLSEIFVSLFFLFFSLLFSLLVVFFLITLIRFSQFVLQLFVLLFFMNELLSFFF